MTKLSQKSDTTAAVKYALGRWEALTRYAEDGGLEIDNNAAERALRAVALGRKNYLFAGSDKGSERAATLYSLIGTAKLNGLDPESYLRDIALPSRLPVRIPSSRIEQLLPWNVVAPGSDPQFGTEITIQSSPCPQSRSVDIYLPSLVNTVSFGRLRTIVGKLISIGVRHRTRPPCRPCKPFDTRSVGVSRPVIKIR